MLFANSCLNNILITVESERVARERKNPNTDAKIKVTTCKVPAFKTDKAFKDLLK